MKSKGCIKIFRCGKSAPTIACATIAWVLLTGVTSGDATWRQATAGYKFVFPRDHGAHEDFKIEWWYYTGTVQTKDGRRFGYQLTFFRTGVQKDPVIPSRWAIRDLYIAHFALSDISAGQFRFFDRMNRAGVGWAGAATNGTRIWNEDWEAQIAGPEHLLRAQDKDCAIRLRLRSLKPAVAHGDNGLSRKGSREGNASHYYSLTRLQTSGVIVIGDEELSVFGSSWMDHEFGTSFLEPGAIGWDWLSLQLDGGRELMCFNIRSATGESSPFSSGTIIEEDGTSVSLAASAFVLRPVDVWQSPISGAKYPVRWTVDVPNQELRLTIEALLPNQELHPKKTTGFPYWEGAVRTHGEWSGQSITGTGYLELTGYTGKRMDEVFR